MVFPTKDSVVPLLFVFCQQANHHRVGVWGLGKVLVVQKTTSTGTVLASSFSSSVSQDLS
jgi:hypothetical protein